MNEFLGSISSLDGLDRIGAVTTVLTIAFLVITRRLVWHTDLKKAEKRADFWEDKAWEAIGVGAAAGVRAAEVTAKVVSSLPDASLDTQSQEIV